MKIKITIIVAFLCSTLVRAQLRIDRPPLSIDSLKKALPLLNNKAKVDCLNELARSYCEKMTLSYADSALKILSQAYKESSAIQYIKGLGEACIQYGLIYTWLKPDYKKCEKYYRETISWNEKIHHLDGLGLGWRGLGILLFNQGAVDKATEAFEKSAFYFKKAANEVMLADLVDWFGIIYGEKGNFEKYFESVKKGLQEKRRIHDNRGIVWSFYRLAYIYVGVKDYETALGYFRQSIQHAEKESMPWQLYRSMGRVFEYMGNYDSSIYYYRKMLQINPSDGPAQAGLGQLLLRKKEYLKAMDYLQGALATFKKNIDLAGEIWVLVDIGKTYAGMKHYDKALAYARICLMMAKQRDNQSVMQYAYEIHWKVYDELKKTDSAYFYYRQFAALKDFLADAAFKRQYLQKLALYKVESREEEQQARIDLLNKDNQLKQQQLQKEALQKKILIGSLAALILLSIIILRNITLKRLNEKHQRELAENELQIQKLESERTKAELQQQATELEMQALRAQMNPHFIFNCLSSINRFILKNETEAASDYLTKFSRLIRMVLTNSKKPFINLEDELDMLRLYLNMERLRFKNSFEYNIGFKNEIDPENIFIPPLLLQPFAENAVWHGLMHKQGQGHLEITLSKEKKILTCIITDDGIGRNKAAMLENRSVIKHKSMGLQITTERLALLNQDKDAQSSFNIEDITDDEGNVAGTRVILKMHYKDMVEAFV